MDKRTAMKFRELFDSEEFKKLAADHFGEEVEVKVGKRVKYDDCSVNSEVMISFGGVSPAKVEWDRSCYRIGLRPEDFGKKITLPGGFNTYVVCGINTRAHKHPVRIKSPRSGKVYKLPKHLNDLIRVGELA